MVIGKENKASFSRNRRVSEGAGFDDHAIERVVTMHPNVAMVAVAVSLTTPRARSPRVMWCSSRAIEDIGRGSRLREVLDVTTPSPPS